MALIETTLQAAFALDGITNNDAGDPGPRLSFADLSEDLDENEALDVVGGKRTKFFYLLQIRQDVENLLSPYSLDSCGVIHHGRLNMITYGNKPIATVNAGIAWLQKIWNSPTGNLGQFGREFEYQSLLRIFSYHPTGGPQRFVSKHGGKLWKNIQNIEFAANTI